MTSSLLKKLRRDSGFTQRQLAELVGVSQAHIAKIENEKVDPRLSTVNRILQVLTEGEGRKCKEIMTKKVIFAKPSDKVLKIGKAMMKKAISQLPVMYNGKIIGTVTEESIIKNLHPDIADKTVADVMGPPLPCVPEETDISLVRPLLEDHPGLLIVQKGDITGIMTRSDLLKTLSNAV